MEPIDPEWLRREAEVLGLSAGLSGVEPGPERDRLLRWLAEGRHATMDWMGRNPDRRADPARVLEGAASVISIAAPAHPPEFERLSGAGRVARYAMGSDYHDLVLQKVRALRRRLEDPLARAYVDTGPVLEKARAQRAGLGWIGKHTNLVSRTLGSFYFLGAILSTRPAAEGPGHRDHCGTCTRCLRACPTGAIRIDEPYQLDARRCIAYLTIEHRGPIPHELRPAIGGWIFGCDLCLEVCPWNRFAQVSREQRLHPRPGWQNPDLPELLSWDDERFRDATRQSPIRRTGRTSLLRNVTIALGNLGGTGAIDALRRCLAGEREALVRGHAAWALGRLSGGSDPALAQAAASDLDDGVRAEATLAMRCADPDG